MIEIVNLKNTLNPITAAERVKINENWDELRRAFSQIQLQINFLSGGKEVNEIIERIENAIRMAETGSQQAIDRVNEALSDLNVTLNNLQTLTTETNAAKDNAISATNDAMNAIQEISDFMNDFRSLGPWNSTTQYKRNNMVSLNGNTYIAKVDNVGSPVTEGAVWTLFARRGFDGERGPQGEAGASLNVRGSLPNESALPSTGVPGDAYTINGNLYVWSVETSGWVNVGQIKGEKGDKGDTGESGFYQLANFQYVINATSNGQTTLQIPLESFDENNHSLLLFRNSVAQSNDLYSISGRTITLNEPVNDYTQTSFYLFITQGVLIQPQETINASFLMDNTVQKSKLSNDLRTEINNSTSHIDKIASTSQLGHVMVDGTTITIDANGKIKGANTYTLPTATTSVLGGIKPDGTTITVNPTTGVASAVISGSSDIPFSVFKKSSAQSVANGVSGYITFDQPTNFNGANFAEIKASDNLPRVKIGGTYLIIGHASFRSNATGYRSLELEGIGNGRVNETTALPVPNGDTLINSSLIVKKTAASDITFRTTQTSGSALDTRETTYLIIARLGD